MVSVIPRKLESTNKTKQINQSEMRDNFEITKILSWNLFLSNSFLTEITGFTFWKIGFCSRDDIVHYFYSLETEEHENF